MTRKADTAGTLPSASGREGAGEAASSPADGSEAAGDGETAEPAGRVPSGSSRMPVSLLRRPAMRRRILRIVAAATALLIAGTAVAAWIMYRNLDDNIRTDSNTAEALGGYEKERPLGLVTEAENILLIGSDDRSGENARYGSDGGTQRSDTTILLHLSRNRDRATAVSIPRDLITRIPACRQEDGQETTPQLAQFNWAFQFGGAACTIRTVEEMTGIRVDHHMIVDFTGFKNMVDAVGGVEVCLPEAVKDEDAQLDLPAGRQTVTGEDALAYVRARHSFGDGSDTQRMDRQQQFLASLVNKVKSSGVLLNPTKLYPLLDAATSSLTADAGLDSLGELYDLMRGLQRTPQEAIGFLTVPRRPYVFNPNRDELVQPAADELFAALREDRPVKVAEKTSERDARPGPDSAGDSGEGSDATDRGNASDGGEVSPHDGPTVSADPDASESPSASSPSMADQYNRPNSAGYPGVAPNHDICGIP